MIESQHNMNLKNLYIKNKYPLKFGLSAAILCVGLFILYLTITPLIGDNEKLQMPIQILWLSTLHIFPFGASFYYGQRTPLSEEICKPINDLCSNWTSEKVADCQAYVMPSGDTGCCLKYTTQPDPACIEKIGLTALVTSSLLLILLYFVIGFIFGIFYKNRLNNKQSEHENKK